MSREMFLAVMAALLVARGRATQEIWLISFQPFAGGSWSGGISMRVGAEIMLEEINAHPGLLPGFQLRVVWQDGYCDADVVSERYLENLVWQKYAVFAPGRALGELDANGDGTITGSDVEPFQEVWNSSVVQPSPVGLLADSCSGPTMELARVAPVTRMPQISPGAAFASLSDRSLYPNFFRTHSPDTYLIPAWFALAKDLGISSAVAVLSDLGFAATAGAFIVAALSQGMQLVGNSFAREVPGFHGVKVREANQPSAAAAAADLVRYQQRVVALCTYGKTLRLILCEAHKRGFVNGVYMVYGWVGFGWWGVQDTDCAAEQLTGMALAHVAAAQQYFRPDATARLDCSAGMTVRDFVAEMWRRQNATPGDWSKQPAGFAPTKEAATMADAVCMYAQALHDVLIARGLAMSELTGRTPLGYAAMISAFAATDFDGVASRVRFPPGSGDPKASVVLTQLQEEGGALRMAAMATFNENLHYLGEGNLVFQLPGEVFTAGPFGASTLGANRLRQFRVCGGNRVLDMRTNSCVDCPANTTFAQYMNSCVCSAGLFETGSGCSPCPAGTYSATAGTLVCAACSPGTFSPPGSRQCSFCPRGSYSSTVGSEACRSCPPLHTTVDIASSSRGACVCGLGAYRDGRGGCRSCPDGALTQGSDSPSVASCLCPEHAYMDMQGCAQCPTGSSTHGAGKTNISSCRCGRDSYMLAGACVPCPSGSSTTGEGRTSVRSCLCSKGTYMPLGEEACLACPEGMLCPRGSSEANTAFTALVVRGEEQEFLKLLPRHWASSSEPMAVFECRSELRCPGDRYPGDACAPHLERRSCEFCAEGYSWRGAACEPCSGLARSFFLFPVLPILSIPAVLVALYRISRDTYERWGSWRNGVCVVAFITLSQYQLLDLVVNCNVALPRFIKDVLGIWAFSNNPTAAFNLECLGLSDVESSMIIQGLTPIVLAAACASVYGCSLLVARLADKAWLAMQRDRLLNIYGSLVFAFFNAVVALSLMLFKCKDNPNGTKSLTVDMSAICFTSGQWQSLLATTIVLLLVYGIGVVALFIRTVMVAPRYFSDAGFQARWKFLFIKYRADVFWWSLVFLAQNLFINLSFVVTSEGALQLHLTMLVTGAYMSSLIVVYPYRHRVVNILDFFVRVSIIYIAALLTWHDADRKASRGLVHAATDAAVAIISFLPTVAALCAVVHLFKAGKRFPPSVEQVHQAEQEFKEMVDRISRLGVLDAAEGGKLILTLEEWDRWYLHQGTRAIGADVLALDGFVRTTDTSVFKLVRTATQSGSFLYESENSTKDFGRWATPTGDPPCLEDIDAPDRPVTAS